ncbi:MAG: Flp pilus assembly complex ATPase component TadA, partial [Desulfobacteraceae bacterium]|nr:Flp pilus assembly complex ATPase component TadA [Desulfobacteraceae bacterium]
MKKKYQTIPSIDSFGLKGLTMMAYEKKGIILLTGESHSGKSTTAAALIEKINQTRSAHVILLENDFGYELKQKKAF